MELAFALLDVLAPLARVLHTPVVGEELTIAVALSLLPLAFIAVAVVPDKFSLSFL